MRPFERSRGETVPQRCRFTEATDCSYGYTEPSAPWLENRRNAAAPMCHRHEVSLAALVSLRDVHARQSTALMEPRWTMSFMRGPMTASEIRRARAGGIPSPAASHVRSFVARRSRTRRRGRRVDVTLAILPSLSGAVAVQDAHGHGGETEA